MVTSRLRRISPPRWRLPMLAAAGGIAVWIVGFHDHSHGNLVLTAPDGSQSVVGEWRLGAEQGERVQVSAGEITLAMENTDTTIHDFVLMRGVDPETGEPVTSVDAFGPGETGSRTVSLEPGAYVLYCDIPGHYAQGMYFAIEVQ